MTMEFALFGDLRVSHLGKPVKVGHARQRSVLTVLLLGANRVVSTDELVDRVWGEQPLPEHPASTLQTYVSLLRRTLAVSDRVSITYQAGGYRLAVDERAVDVHLFRQLVSQARRIGNEERARAELGRALALWRGDPFPSFDTAWLNATRTTLRGERYAAQLDFAERCLRLGRHATLLVELADWVAQHPLDERLAGQYMLALYRSGRQADALIHYQRIRRQLAEELGTDPGPALRLLYQQALTADPALSVPSATVLAQLPVPQELPTDTLHFTGRKADIARLDTLLNDATAGCANGSANGSANAMPIISVDGAPGVGKTTLAVHWALRVRDRFPDGQLYANLRAFDAGRPALHPTDVLEGFLHNLNVAPEQVPPGLEARAGLYRSLLAGRRMLVLLDNAASGEQVRPLLPGSTGCLALVTSRCRLTGLARREGMRPVTLRVFAEAEAIELLRKIIRPPRADAELGALVGIARACGYLPSALRLVAERVVDRPGLSLASLLRELADAHEDPALIGLSPAGARRLLETLAAAYQDLKRLPGAFERFTQAPLG